MAALVKAVVAVLALVGVVLAQNPGFQVALTNYALEYARQVGLPIILAELQTISIPDISGDTDTPVGHVSYDLTSIKVKSVAIPTSSLAVGNNGIVLAISGTSVNMGANWHYREDSWPHVSDSGSADISASSISINVQIGIGVTANHEPSVVTQSCSANIGSLNIDFHGGASWLYNLFSDLIADAIKSDLNGQLCKIISDEINVEANKALATLPESEKIDKYANINFELLTNPLILADYVLTQHKGEFVSNTAPAEAPFKPQPIPNPGTGTLNRMLYVWLTDYILESAGWVYMTAGVLTYTVLPSDVPPDFPIQLNTTYFKDLIPALYAKYPNLPMELKVQATGAPLEANMSPAGFNATITINVTVSVIQNTQVIDVFTLLCNIDTAAQVWVAQVGTQVAVQGNLTFLTVEMAVQSTSIGPLNLGPLQFIANILCEKYLISEINKRFEQGFPIPLIDGISLVNPGISFGNGFVLISTDVHYSSAMEPKYFRYV